MSEASALQWTGEIDMKTHIKKSVEQRQAERISKSMRLEVKRFEETGTRAEAVKVLKGAGILNKQGRLAKQYRTAH